MADETTRMARAEQADAALKTFLGPAFDLCRSEYIEKLAEIAAKPLNADFRAGMEKLALAIKVVDQVRSQIEALVADGRVAADDARRARDLMALTPEQRKWAMF